MKTKKLCASEEKNGDNSRASGESGKHKRFGRAAQCLSKRYISIEGADVRDTPLNV